MSAQTPMKGTHVLVVGLGLHGGAIGTIQWLAAQGATITVSDTKTKEALAPSVEKLKDIPNITYHFGNQDELSLDGISMVIRNPGVLRTAPILQRARELSIPIEMDSSLFFEYCPSKNIIGITGSKGKTTTSSAIRHVLSSLIPQTVAVGIDGASPLGLLETITPYSPVVFELSSWRLESLQEKKLSPHIAVATSIYKDHLNTYESFQEYIETKRQIIRDQTENDIAILNYDDHKIRAWEPGVRGALYWYSLEKLPDDKKGIWVEGNLITVRVDTESIICTTTDIPHTSSYELRNELPSILIGLLHGGEVPQIISAFKTIPTLAHRLQVVKVKDGVTYINDSAATMPDATIAALRTFPRNPLLLILGGSDKALEFEELAQEISRRTNISHLIWLPGTATDRMKQEILPHTNASSYYVSSMDEAVRMASEHAREGDTVLLSPGATSFGLFLHEFDRGDSFIRAVEQL